MPIENLNLWECPNGHNEFEIETRDDCKIEVRCSVCGATKVIPFLMVQYYKNPWTVQGEEIDQPKTEKEKLKAGEKREK